MASLQQVNEALEKVVKFLSPLLPMIGCHMVDFLTLRHWETLLPTQIQHDLLSLPPEALHQLPSATLPHSPDHNTIENNAEPWSLSSSDLPTFLSQVCKHCPAALGVTTPIEQILDQYGSAEISVLPMKGIMSHKKTHEVEVMGQVIARLAKGLGVTWLVDLGSGRGYLSSSLVLQYDQRVVAIDSSSSNTSSALARNTKLKRLWDNLTLTSQDRAEGRRVKKGKSRRRKVIIQQQQQHEQDRRQGDVKLQNTGVKEESLPTQLNGRFLGVTKFITEDTDLLELVRSAVGSEKITSEGQNSRCLVSEKVISGNRRQSIDFEDTSDVLPDCPNTLKSQTHATTPTKDNTRYQEQHSPLSDTTCMVNDMSVLGLVGLHTCGNLASSSLRLFIANPKVNFLCNVGCCYHLLEEEYSRNTFNQRKPPDEAGLSVSTPVHKEENGVVQHAGEEHLMTVMKQDCCASQSSTSHYEQVGNTAITDAPHRSKESLIHPTTEKEVCLAPRGQCSNTVEKHCNDLPPPHLQVPPEPPTTKGQGEGDIDPLHPSRIPNLEYGFPLSSFLRGRRFSLGRNTRMLSSQAADRLTQGNISGPDSLYWRALLQVVLEDKLEDVSKLSHVGRLSAKCQSFTEYAKAAMARLGVSINVTDKELDEYDQKYSIGKHKLERFFLLRASLAAVAEGAMLLDRLAFLCEQEDVSAYLVPLFDPVTSPRSHAIVAVRSGYTLTPSRE